MESRINTGLGHNHQALNNFPGETLPISGLNQENLAEVAHKATHIQNFAWYTPAPTDQIAAVKIAPASEDILLGTASLPTVLPAAAIAAKSIPISSASLASEASLAPITSDFSSPAISRPHDIETGDLTPRKALINESETSNIPLENTANTISNVADNLFERAQSEKKPAKVKKMKLGQKKTQKFQHKEHKAHWAPKHRDLPRVPLDEDLNAADDKWDWNTSRRCPTHILALEEKERQERMASGPNAALLRNFGRFVHPYIYKSSTQVVPSALREANNLVKDTIKSTLNEVRNVVDAALDDVSARFDEGLIFDEEEEPLLSHSADLANRNTARSEVKFTPRTIPQWVYELEDLEREIRRLEGINPILSGKVNRYIHPYIRDLNGNYLPSLVAKSARSASNLASGAFEKAKDTLASMMPVDTTPARFEKSAESIGLGAGDKIDFNFRPNMAWLDLLEENERQDRLSRGVCPVLFGKNRKFVLRPLLSYKNSVLPSFVFKARKNASQLANDVIEKAKDTYNSAFPADTSIARFERSGASIGLGFGEKVDLVNIARRTPAWVLDAEEKERALRMALGVDPVLLGRHRQYVLRPLLGYKWSMPAASSMMSAAPAVVASAVEATPAALAETAKAVQHTASSWTSLAGSLLGSAVHLVQDAAVVAKERVYGPELGSTAYISKEEEKERIRRMNASVDPLMDARKRRVELELLHEIKPAV